MKNNDFLRDFPGNGKYITSAISGCKADDFLIPIFVEQMRHREEGA